MAFRIHQAKGEFHRTRADVAFRGGPESVKLRGNSIGRAPTWRSVAFRIRQAKGEFHRTRADAAFRGGSESVKLGGNSIGRAPTQCFEFWLVGWKDYYNTTSEEFLEYVQYNHNIMNILKNAMFVAILNPKVQ